MRLVHLLRGLTVELDLFGAEFAARSGLHPTDLRALIHLLDAARAGEVVTPGRLGEALRLNSAGTTGLVDRLERLGLIRRERDPGDRRRVRLVVEERAMELGQGFFGGLIGDLVVAMGRFDPAELATARRFLEAMTSVVAAARTESRMEPRTG
ncbi:MULTISPECIES: MarR family winged helix-turn-helix transcriptional regulator [Kitasatospora]|uniref:MarR family transcriptional regulator n=1 Tax=Kitasatospora cathayae TaxID=3004092 RepID=A0ABY7QFD1_9ACTN|nr:MarR family transcriptional regulator [Kitasatospora sp. HUAS 3-15]WBP91485.1 MarR family transcriptional regulator [Kitasatospora sp. HUAS 3-15]